MFTIYNWIFVGVWIVGTIIVSIGIYFMTEESVPAAIISALVSIIICAVIMGIIGWYHTSTASGLRDMKDYRSELDNGIEKKITITAEDGREIFHYEGKVDIESDHTDNYIKFESEEGKRYLIYYGVQDTITIIEK